MPGSWAGSTRGRATASRAWRALRASVLERDAGVCYLCGGPGADTVDHIRSVANGGTDEPANLAAVHDRTPPHCHRAKTAAERRPVSRRRPAEPHPGMLTTGEARPPGGRPPTPGSGGSRSV